ncbi:MAG TPA: hypothetical protein VGD54_17240 [Steroidobacteraceae bacterium]
MSIEDPLKPLDELLNPDSRRSNIVGTLAEEHADLEDIRLNVDVPVIVAQLFETAKNVSLYSWFVYRFHPVSESVAFSALELALNLRKTGLTLLPHDFRSQGLSRLLREAVESGLLRESAFPSRAAYVAQAARMTIVARLIAEGLDNVEVSEPTPQEILQASSQLSLTKHLLQLWPTIRNTLAHGSPRLTPNSRQTLRLIAEAINQLFPQGSSAPMP